MVAECVNSFRAGTMFAAPELDTPRGANVKDPNAIYLVISLLKTTATLWLGGEVIEAWDYRTGKDQNLEYGWLICYDRAVEIGAA